MLYYLYPSELPRKERSERSKHKLYLIAPSPEL